MQGYWPLPEDLDIKLQAAKEAIAATDFPQVRLMVNQNPEFTARLLIYAQNIHTSPQIRDFLTDMDGRIKAKKPQH